nr:phospholipase-like protein [Tanacetum cinerariifolium]
MGHELGYAVDDVFLRMVDNLEAWNVFPWGEHIWRELYTAIKNVNLKHKDVHHNALEINPNFVSSYSFSGFVLCFKIWILESSYVTRHWWRKLSEEIPERPFLVEAFSISKLGWYTPRAPPVEYDGLFGDYLKKLSLARTIREKDREAWSGITPKTKATHVKHKVNTACTKLKSKRQSRGDLMLEEENSMKSIDRSNSNHMKLALEKCGTTKRSSVWHHCKFPWCNDVVVDRPFWDSLIGLDDNRLGWLHEEATYEIYPLAWRDVEQTTVLCFLKLFLFAPDVYVLNVLAAKELIIGRRIPRSNNSSQERHHEIAKYAKLIRIEDQFLVLIKRQVKTKLMLEEKFRDLCEEVSNFVKEIEDVVKDVERLSCKDVVKETVCLLRHGQKRDLYKMTRLQMMVNGSHLSVSEKHTFVSKMNLGTIS